MCFVGVLRAALGLREETLWILSCFCVVLVGLSLGELFFEGGNVVGSYGESGGLAAEHLGRSSGVSIVASVR